VKFNFQASELDRFRGAITQHLGLRFEDSKLDELAEALSARMKTTSSSKVEAYLSSLAVSREEQHALAGHLTVPETFFFRMADHFRALEESVLPELMESPSRRVRILSAGCASGEEAYSIAMLVRDCACMRGTEATIRGIDINPAVIAKARQGRYTDWSMRETPPEIRERHFRKHGRHFELSNSIREMVVFEEGNLIDPKGAFWQKESFDVIFLRNVLMYFSPDAAKGVIGRVAESMVPGGYLFLGSAETLRGVSQEFHLCQSHGSFYYRRRSRSESRPRVVSRELATTGLSPVSHSVPEIQGDWLKTIRLAAKKIEDLTRRPGELRKSVMSNLRNPDNPKARSDVSAAMDLMRQERFADALDALPQEKVTGTDAQLLRAVALANAGRLAEAEDACNLLLKDDELNAGAHYVMALCREYAVDLPAAADHDQAAIYLDPSFAMPHLHCGLLARRTGDLVVARRELRQAVLLLEREDASRILLFGGGFSRESLVELCNRELKACGGNV
jgi:chemotaxis protein methyltransferase CheR